MVGLKASDPDAYQQVMKNFGYDADTAFRKDLDNAINALKDGGPEAYQQMVKDLE